MASWILNYTELERVKIRKIVVKQLNGEPLQNDELALITRWNADKLANEIDFGAIQDGKIAEMETRTAVNTANLNAKLAKLETSADDLMTRYLESTRDIHGQE